MKFIRRFATRRQMFFIIIIIVFSLRSTFKNDFQRSFVRNIIELFLIHKCATTRHNNMFKFFSLDVEVRFFRRQDKIEISENRCCRMYVSRLHFVEIKIVSPIESSINFYCVVINVDKSTFTNTIQHPLT